MIKDMVEIPHFIYQNYVSFWNFLLQSYEGGLDYTSAMMNTASSNQSLWDSLFQIFVDGQRQTTQTVSGNLFMHPKERTEDYNRRMQMSYYYNFCSPIVDIYTNHLFKQSVIENFENLESDIEEVSENIDRCGSSISEFRKQIASLAQLYGHIYVIVDSPSISQSDVLTRQDQIERGAFPYLTTHCPQNVINWALDQFGSPYWVLIREIYDSNTDALNYDKNKKANIFYRLWTRNDWILFDDEYKEIAKGTHALGTVPIVCIFDKKSKKVRNFLGVSSISDISLIARDVYNSSSELRQILRDQTFAFLAVQGTSDEYSDLQVGTGKGLLYPEGRNVPQYVSPPVDNAKTYFEHIDRQVAKIYQLAKLEGGSASFKGQSAVEQSGVSKAWDFNETNSSLAEKAMNLEDGETKIWQLFAKWLGIDFDGSVQYPTEFSTSDLMTDLDEAEKEARIGLGKTFDIAVRKAIHKKKFPSKTEEELDEMAKEVEEKLSGETEVQQFNQRISSLFTKTPNSAAQ